MDGPDPLPLRVDAAAEGSIAAASFGQEQLWLLDQILPDRCVYNETWVGGLTSLPPAEREIDEGATAALRALARKEKATPYMALLAAFQVLLHRSTGEEDFAVGTPTSRSRSWSSVSHRAATSPAIRSSRSRCASATRRTPSFACPASPPGGSPEYARAPPSSTSRSPCTSRAPA